LGVAPPTRTMPSVRLRLESGQTAVEYAGLLTVVATIVLAIVTLDLPRHLRDGVNDAVCELTGGTDCGRTAARTRFATRDDPDGDGLTTRQERRLGTSVRDADTDGDGVADGDEARRKLNPRSRDSDRDGIEDARELQLARTKGTDPRKADSDGDGLTDGAELAAGTPPRYADFDHDTRGGDPDASGLGDGLSDFEEIYVYGTDPTHRDTDLDGATDGEEVKAGTNPLVDERSLGYKVGLGVTGFFLDDPSNLSPKGIAKGLAKGLGKLGAKLGVKSGAKVAEDAADTIAAARRRRQAAAEGGPGTGRGVEVLEGETRLVGANRAQIDPRKLTDYALNPEHPVGGDKARVFESAFGFKRGNADDLLAQIRKGVMENRPIPGKVDAHGTRFTVDIPVNGPTGSGTVRTGWIFDPGSVTPRMTTLFVK
jgi:Flp pilus assembly pilin Flp